MTYQHQKMRKASRQQMGETDFVEIEFILKEDVELEKSETSLESEHKYELSKKYSLREKWSDRKMKRKTLIKVERPVSTAEYSVATYRVAY